MRIGLITPGISADEQDWCIPALRHLVRQLATEHDVRVLALRYPFQARSYPLFGAQVTALGGRTMRKLNNLKLWRAALRALARMHRERPFDVLHVFWATESGALAAVAARMLGIPVVVNIAGGELAALRDAAYGGQLVQSERLKIRIALTLADLVAAGSDWACQMAEPFLRGRPQSARGPRCIWLPLGVETALFHPQAPAHPEPVPRLVHAASLVPVKDQAMLLRALALLKGRNLPFVAEIAGEGILDAPLKQHAHDLGLSDRVRFRGPLPHDQLPGFFHGATAFLLSSLHESQCMAVLEAAACGIPTVGTDVGVVAELAPRAALAVPIGDHAALADAIEVMLRSAARRDALAAAAERTLQEVYRLDLCAARTVESYRLAQARRASR